MLIGTVAIHAAVTANTRQPTTSSTFRNGGDRSDPDDRPARPLLEETRNAARTARATQCRLTPALAPDSRPETALLDTDPVHGPRHRFGALDPAAPRAARVGAAAAPLAEGASYVRLVPMRTRIDGGKAAAVYGGPARAGRERRGCRYSTAVDVGQRRWIARAMWWCNRSVGSVAARSVALTIGVDRPKRREPMAPTALRWRTGVGTSPRCAAPPPDAGLARTVRTPPGTSMHQQRTAARTGRASRSAPARAG